MSSIHFSSVAPARLTANERMKRRWNGWLGGSIFLAVALHAAVLLLWPRVDVPLSSPDTGEAVQAVSIASAASGIVRNPPPPGEIVAPQLPTSVQEEVELSLAESFSVPVPLLGDAAAEAPIAPPVLSTEDEWLDYKSFAPFVVAPAVRNKREVRRYLERHYQRILEFSGATGVVQVHFWIDEAGGVARAEVVESSGSRSLDRLAMRLSRVLRFSPAMRLGRPVRVLVRLPITFRES